MNELNRLSRSLAQRFFDFIRREGAFYGLFRRFIDSFIDSLFVFVGLLIDSLIASFIGLLLFSSLH